MRILALDYGRKRIGVAISDPLGITAQPQPYLPASKKIIEEVQTLVQVKQIEKIIVGLPLTMKGTDSEMTIEVRAFTKNLQEKILIPIELYDERCTSDSANRLLIEANVSRQKRKEVVDSIAAAILLQSYMMEHG